MSVEESRDVGSAGVMADHENNFIVQQSNRPRNGLMLLGLRECL